MKMRIVRYDESEGVSYENGPTTTISELKLYDSLLIHGMPHTVIMTKQNSYSTSYKIKTQMINFPRDEVSFQSTFEAPPMFRVETIKLFGKNSLKLKKSVMKLTLSEDFYVDIGSESGELRCIYNDQEVIEMVLRSVAEMNKGDEIYLTRQAVPSVLSNSKFVQYCSIMRK